MNMDQLDDHEEEEEEMEMEAPPSNNNNSSRFRYRECLKNHAVGLGGHALDGCGEFMPAGAEGTLDALKCAACTCHRNFHRKEDRWAPPPQFYHRPAPGPAPAGYLQVAGAQRHLLALPSTSGGEDEPGSGSSGRKRFRTKFTPEQKEKMVELAERVGWRIQKHDEEVVQTFCNENGVKRHVLKVWMHNNKHTLACCSNPRHTLRFKCIKNMTNCNSWDHQLLPFPPFSCTYLCI